MTGPAKTRVGVIGCGDISRADLTGYTSLGRAAVVAIADTLPKAAEARTDEFGVESMYEDYREMLDEEDIDSLRNRRIYATTALRMTVEFEINGRPMGSAVEAGDLEVSVRAVGTEEIARVELVESGLATTIADPFRREVELGHQLGRRAQRPDHLGYCYLRLLPVDGNKAWTSPIWIDG